MDMPTPFHDLVPVARTEIGRFPVQSVNARDLHAALQVGRDFSNWIKGRIDRFGFVEGQDYATFSVAAGGGAIRQNGRIGENQKVMGGRPALEYVLTLDMAKELAMVENNDQGRAVRRYFIQCERLVREMMPEGMTPQVVGGIVKGIVRRAVDEAIHAKLPEIIEAQILADPRKAAINCVTSLEVCKQHDVPAKGRRAFSTRVGNKLARASAEAGVPVYLSPETGRRMFQRAATDGWLAREGLTLIAQHKARLAGQGVLKLVPKN